MSNGRFICLTFCYATLLLVALGAHTTHAQIAPSAADISNAGALHQAAFSGDTLTAKKLIQENADLEVRDRAGRTPIIVAAFASHENMVRLLNDFGADMNALENQEHLLPFHGPQVAEISACIYLND